MKKRPWILLIISLLYACSPNGLMRNGEKLEPAKALSLAIAQNEAINTFSGKARIAIESPEEAQSFDADVFFKNPDSALVIVDYLFGADAAYLSIIKSRYLFYNKVNDNFLAGNTSDSFSKAFFRLPLPMSEFSNLLIGKTAIDSSLLGKKMTETEEGYLFEGRQGDYSYFYLIDPKFARVKRLEIYSADSELILSQEFEDFILSKSIFFPRQIILKRPDKKQYISIYYTDIKINQGFDDSVFDISVPPSANQLDLDRP